MKCSRADGELVLVVLVQEVKKTRNSERLDDSDSRGVDRGKQKRTTNNKCSTPGTWHKPKRTTPKSLQPDSAKNNINARRRAKIEARPGNRERLALQRKQRRGLE